MAAPLLDLEVTQGEIGNADEQLSGFETLPLEGPLQELAPAEAHLRDRHLQLVERITSLDPHEANQEPGDGTHDDVSVIEESKKGKF